MCVVLMTVLHLIIYIEHIAYTYMVVSYGIWTTKRLKPIELCGKKNKYRIDKLPSTAHNIIVHNLSYNYDMCLDMRIIE